ncbi:MAG: PAS domain-containing sensor histidine kinase [Pseudomonadota bacterium]|nr:PAS domain-containing sensor histidine kinase [Pseudomonadota bacterium]
MVVPPRPDELLGEQHRRLVAQSLDACAIITSDLEGRITSWNPGATALFGHTEAQALGQPCELIFTVEDAKAGVARQEMRTAAACGRADDERWMQRKNGEVLFCSGVVTPLVEGGELVGYAKICRDFTAWRLASVARESASSAAAGAGRQMEEVNGLNDEFLAVTTHELRNPLNTIQLTVLMLERSKAAREDPDVQRAVATIATAVHSQRQMIDDLMDMSRLRTRKLGLALGSVDFGDVVRQIVAAVAPVAERRRQLISLQTSGPPSVLWADRVRVEQIAWNLVNNAIKFTPEDGTIAISLESRPPLAKLTVADNGIGLAAADLGSVFEMFKQADASAAGRGGMGIGLALVKQLAELHGGRVAVESAGLGRGASFSVWLPLAPAPASPPARRP